MATQMQDKIAAVESAIYVLKTAASMMADIACGKLGANDSVEINKILDLAKMNLEGGIL